MDVATSNWPALGGAELADSKSTPAAVELGVVVREVEPMAAFYRDALGCEEFGRFEAPGTVVVAMSFGNGIFKLLRQDGDKLDPKERGFEVRGIQYMTFKVNDIDRAFEGVLRAGGTAVSEPSAASSACKFALFRDVEGNLVELVQGAPW